MSETGMIINKSVIDGKDAVEIVDAYVMYDKRIDAIVQEIIEQGRKELVIDCKRMTYVTSMAVGQILKLVKIFQGIGGQLYLYKVNDDIKQYFIDISLYDYFKILP